MHCNRSTNEVSYVLSIVTMLLFAFLILLSIFLCCVRIYTDWKCHKIHDNEWLEDKKREKGDIWNIEIWLTAAINPKMQSRLQWKWQHDRCHLQSIPKIAFDIYINAADKPDDDDDVSLAIWYGNRYHKTAKCKFRKWRREICFQVLAIESSSKRIIKWNLIETKTASEMRSHSKRGKKWGKRVEQ